MSKLKNKDALIGRTIVDVQKIGMHVGAVPCLLLDDGTKVFVMSDSEGNEPGCLHIHDTKPCKKAKTDLYRTRYLGGRSCLGF